MRYVIYGAGAIGGVIGARLVQHRERHGHEVVLIARGEHLRVMQRDGLRFRAPGEDFRLPVTAVASPSEVEWRGDEVVLLTMKTQDTPDALDDLRAAAGTDVPVLCAQNGLENERMAARRFRDVYAMLVHLPATHLEPGEVLLNGTGVSGVLHAGRYPTGTDATIEAVCAGLVASDFAADPTPTVMRLKHTKLLQNLGNAVQATCARDADVAGLLRLLREEAIRVFDAAGMDWSSEEFAERVRMIRMDGIVEGFDRPGGSTLQSLARGASTLETDYLNGEVMLLGTLHGVPTPVNRAVQDTVVGILHGRAPMGSVPPEAILDRAREYGFTG
ncbi:MAG: ketopantoate reductase family protein [Dehalococcoidia bacterium]|nr:ketopantoate reductase family protein [Dehalococcoidia bacterium]